jgi:hypothetical protein
MTIFSNPWIWYIQRGMHEAPSPKLTHHESNLMSQTCDRKTTQKATAQDAKLGIQGQPLRLFNVIRQICSRRKMVSEGNEEKKIARKISMLCADRKVIV